MSGDSTPNRPLTSTKNASRMRSGDRRELVLEAATEIFGEFGYVGSTTQQVARAAGVSQPYVSRMFGTKEKLFLEVLGRALGVLLSAFRAEIARDSDVHLGRRLGGAYVSMLRQRGVLLSLMHGFVLGSDPVIGAYARQGLLEVYGVLRDEAGFSPAESQQFLATGMLVNTMIGTRMIDDFDSNPAARELLEAAFPDTLDLYAVLGAASDNSPRNDA
jgi:AcrR family transcriptional regulator